MRCFVVYGQGGFITSMGMYALATRIRALSPKLLVTTHDWYEHLDLPAEPSILIGYSLGANSVTWNAANGRPVKLAVCYDPSALGIIVQPRHNIEKLLLYHNNSFEPIGHLRFQGPQVETTEVHTSHLFVCYDEELHQKTLAAVRKIVQ